MRLDLADLRLFIAIVDTGSITGGAANAHLARRPPVRGCARWRPRSACRCCTVMPGVTMTEAGEVLARHARPLLAQQQRLRRAMHAFACGQRGRCACSPTPRRCRPFCREARRTDGSAPGGADRNRRTHQRGYRQLYPGGRGAGRSGVRCGRPGPLRLDPSLTTRWC